MEFRLGTAFINANNKVFVITETHMRDPENYREKPFLTVDILEDRVTHYYSSILKSKLFQVTLSELGNKSNKTTKTIEEMRVAIEKKLIKKTYI